MTPEQRALALLTGIGAAAILLKFVSDRIPLPFPVVLAVAGLAAGSVPGFPAEAVSPAALLLAFIPGLVFEAAINVDLHQLRRHLLPVGLLATVVVALTAAAIAAGTRLLLGVSWEEAALAGAILAPTDPIAVVSVMHRSGAPPRLIALLEGESLFNDGVAVALFATVSAVIPAQAAFTAGEVALRLLVITAGGIAVGVASGVLVVIVLRLVRDPAAQMLATLVSAYGSYLVADLLHASGVVSTVVAGVVIAAAGRRAVVSTTELRDVWGLLGFTLNAVLFLLLGSLVPTRKLIELVWPALALVGIALLVRMAAVMATLTAADRGRGRLSFRWHLVAVWGGMRGALSVALALAVAERSDVDPRLAAVACGAALLSLVLQGATAPALLHRAAERPVASGPSVSRAG